MASFYQTNSVEFSRRLNLNCPFVIPTSVIEENPKFANLLMQLTEVLSPTGCSIKLEKELEKTKVDLRFKKAHYLKNLILYQELENLAIEDDLASNDNYTESEREVLKQANYLISLIEVTGCFDSLAKTEPILGFTHETVETLIPKPEPSFVIDLMSLVKNRINDRCSKLLKYYKMEDDQDPRDIAELPAKLVEDLETVESLSKSLKLQQVNREWQFTQYEKAMIESIDILQELITKFRLSGSTELNAQLAQYFCLKGKALASKLELLQMEILCDTYTKESISALEVISSNLKETFIEKEKTLMDLTRILNTYRSLGDDFDKLLVEYNGLKDTMENKKWALNKLK